MKDFSNVRNVFAIRCCISSLVILQFPSCHISSTSTISISCRLKDWSGNRESTVFNSSSSKSHYMSLILIASHFRLPDSIIRCKRDMIALQPMGIPLTSRVCKWLVVAMFSWRSHTVLQPPAVLTNCGWCWGVWGWLWWVKHLRVAPILDHL